MSRLRFSVSALDRTSRRFRRPRAQPREPRRWGVRAAALTALVGAGTITPTAVPGVSQVHAATVPAARAAASAVPFTWALPPNPGSCPTHMTANAGTVFTDTNPPPAQARQYTYHVDGRGRPDHAIARPLLAGIVAPRNTYCSGRVSNFRDGPRGGAPAWNGGHLIAHSFFGADYRYNLVPQRREVNQNSPFNGVYYKWEQLARDCLAHGQTITAYDIQVVYPPGSNTIFPTRFQVSMTLGNGYQLRAAIPEDPTPAEAEELQDYYFDQALNADC